MLKKLAALVSVPLLALSLSACSGDEKGASKEDVTKGMSKALESYLDSMGLSGLDKSIVDDYAKCIIDESYDSLSADTRETIAKGDFKDIDSAKVPEKEADAIDKAVTDCQDTLIESMMQ